MLGHRSVIPVHRRKMFNRPYFVGHLSAITLGQGMDASQRPNSATKSNHPFLNRSGDGGSRRGRGRWSWYRARPHRVRWDGSRQHGSDDDGGLLEHPSAPEPNADHVIRTDGERLDLAGHHPDTAAGQPGPRLLRQLRTVHSVQEQGHVRAAPPERQRLVDAGGAAGQHAGRPVAVLAGGRAKGRPDNSPPAPAGGPADLAVGHCHTDTMREPPVLIPIRPRRRHRPTRPHRHRASRGQLATGRFRVASRLSAHAGRLRLLMLGLRTEL